MQKHNISSIEELSQKAKDDLEWFWQEVDKRCWSNMGCTVFQNS